MSDDRIEPTLSSFDFDEDTDKSKQKKKASAKTDDADILSDAESDLERELASLGEELKSFDYSDNTKPAAAQQNDDKDDFEVTPIAAEPKAKTDATTKTADKSKPEKSKKDMFSEAIDAQLEDEKASEKKPRARMRADGGSKRSQYEFRSNQQADYEERYQNQYDEADGPSWLSLTGRLDRLRAAVMILALSYFCIALIAFSDPVLKSIASVFGAQVSDAEFLMNPIVYLVIGLGLWLIGLLMITVRRLKDVNRSPFLSILLLLPPISFWVISYCVMPSSQQQNYYGPKPAPYSYRSWIMVGVFMVVIPILIYSNASNFGDYFWEIQKNLSLKVVPKVDQ